MSVRAGLTQATSLTGLANPASVAMLACSGARVSTINFAAEVFCTCCSYNACYKILDRLPSDIALSQLCSYVSVECDYRKAE